MTAVISACGLYRYRLERDVAMQGPVFAFFGVNPSTADATLDDATVRKWSGFVKRWGGSRFIVGNAFAYRATDVRDLIDDPGPAFSLENQKHLREIAAAADVLVPCWGSRAKIPRDLHHIVDCVLHLLRQTGKPVKHMGLTASGDPRHPLMLSYDTPLVDWAKA
ncbi:MAG: DUF1643 domain-containing protein [Burkholderiaceae bacterium]|jgi:hypothetical protein|nr:DUF1643 domain-containing protein [Burkholderiaceae bacterium]MDP3138373.1 DUF1643 domain-containing protein [Burkholderiaceae bacterium]